MSVQQGETLVLRLERYIGASRERVFAAWTQPELLERWSAPEGLEVERGEIDLRPGGQWRVVLAAPDGTRHEAFGVYREVTPPSRLVYTHAWLRENGSTAETTVRIEFVVEGDGTWVRFEQTGFESTGSRDGHAEGWSSSLDRLQVLFGEVG